MQSLSTIAATPVVPFLARRMSFFCGANLAYSSLWRDSGIYIILSQSICPEVTFFEDRNMKPSSLYVGVL